MKKNNTECLSFLETVGRSFKYVFKNKTLIRGILPLVAVLIILQIAIGMPFLCSLTGTCQVGLARNITILSIVLGSAGIIINYCRTIICKAEVDFCSLNFWKQMFYYLLASCVLGVVFFVGFAILLIISAKVLSWVGLGEYVVWGVYIDAIVLFILLAPLFLAFPAIAAEDYKLLWPWNLYKTAKGYHNVIFWGQFTIMVPYWLSFGALKEMYAFLPQHIFVIDLIATAFLVFISMIDACFKGAFFAHIYQNLKKQRFVG